jgi:LacI family transcriptional regulator
VCSDHVRAGALAADHLVTVHGCTATVFVGGFAEEHVQHGDRGTVRERFEGYTSVVGESQRHVTTDLTLAGAYRAVRDAIERDGVPDGLVVGTLLQSTAALRALVDTGARVPADVPVVTFDGDARNEYAPLALTVVQEDVVEIARRSIDLALGVAAHELDAHLGVRLSVAESCGCGSGPR